ncbi:MAG TPA: hypothetical protein VJH24_01430 [Candidatus Bilamarchaeaceae archaeon]|nr:hypothetical protein [Candidatus Bilamarchaeaceae archaeon]
MGEDALLLKLYERIIQRYNRMISEKEDLSVSELRRRISPYNEFIRKLRARLIRDLQPYDYQKHFFSALQRSIAYIKEINNVELPLTFWLTFEEIDQIKAAPIMDQALLLATLLRSLEAKEVKVMVLRSRHPYVYFEWNNEKHLVNPQSGSLLRGEDVGKTLSADPVAYAFSDLFFESYEEE